MYVCDIFVWNFKAYLWNSSQTISPLHGYTNRYDYQIYVDILVLLDLTAISRVASGQGKVSEKKSMSVKSQWILWEVSEELDLPKGQWKVGEFEKEASVCNKNNARNLYFIHVDKGYGLMAVFLVFALSSMPHIFPGIILCICFLSR